MRHICWKQEVDGEATREEMEGIEGMHRDSISPTNGTTVTVSCFFCSP